MLILIAVLLGQIETTGVRSDYLKQGEIAHMSRGYFAPEPVAAREPTGTSVLGMIAGVLLALALVAFLVFLALGLTLWSLTSGLPHITFWAILLAVAEVCLAANRKNHDADRRS
jgi:hypothetical protein